MIDSRRILMRSAALTALGCTCLAFVALATSGSASTAIVHAADAQEIAGDAQHEDPVAIPRPAWKKGDSWTVVTLTRRLQGREHSAGKPGYIAWKFHVANTENIAGRPCHRLEVECLTTGRFRPHSTIWCDQQTLFVRQFQTQVAVGGRSQTLQESYEAGDDQHGAVLTPISVLPIGLPAFRPAGAKSAAESYSYVSRSTPAGSKNADVLPFVHQTNQRVVKPDAKVLENVSKRYAVEAVKKPTVEVRLTDHRQNVVQLWQEGAPWSVYSNNGQTQAWLVADQRAE